MWLLTTRNRPELAAGCLAACARTKMTSRGIFYVDGDEHGDYAGIELQANWTLHVAEHAGLSAALEWCLATYPEEPFYGWLADDMRPMTARWDRLLEEAAGRRLMAQANDHWAFNLHRAGVRAGLEPSAGQCWGGDLLRTVGWWALPGTFQGGTDVAWCQLLAPLGRVRFLEQVVVEHWQWRTGKRPRDELDTDAIDANDHAHTARDVARLYEWLNSRDYWRIRKRVRQQCPV